MKLFCLINYVIGVLHFAECIDYDGWLNIKLLHSVNCGSQDFCTRGNIILQSIRVGTSVIHQSQFTKETVAELTELAKIDGFYSVKTIITSTENKESEFLSSVKAQAFLDNGLSDVINTWVLPNGAVFAVSFQVANYTRPVEILNNDIYKINSSFYLRYADQAPVPDTASYIQKLEREREAREKGDLKENRSFLSKYWMYIVPIAIFVMISGSANPEPAAQSPR